MDLAGFVRRLNPSGRLLPLAAVFADDVRQATRHWALAAWAGLSLTLAVVWFVQASPRDVETSVSNYQDPYAWKHVPAPTLLVHSESASQLAAKALRFHLIVGSGLVILLCSVSFPAESHYVADSLLCRGVSRWQYYLGKCASRTLVSTTAFLLLAAPVVALSAVRLDNDLDWNGVFEALKVSSLFIAGVALVSVAGGAWFQSPLLASAAVALVLYGSAIVVGALALESLSVGALCDHLAELLRDDAVLAPAVGILTVLAWASLIVHLVTVLSFSHRDV